MKKDKIVMIVVLSLVALGALVGGYIMIDKMLDAREAEANKKDGSRPMFYTDAGQEIDFNINAIGDGEVNSVIAKADTEVNVSLQNNYDAMSVCTYDIFWEWSDNPYGYYKTEGSKNEFTITGTIDGVTLFDNAQLNDYNLANPRTYLASYSVFNEGNGISALSLKASLNFHKMSMNQDNHKDGYYPGKIVIDNVACSEATRLKDKDLKINNYVCLSHENTPFCEDDYLYRVIDVNSDGIKIVRLKEYGTAVWSNRLLETNFDNYIKDYLNGYQNAINNHDWKMPNYEELNLSLSSALDIEKKAADTISSMVGVPSLSDILQNEYLNDFTTPYLVLANDGLSYTKAGFNKDSKVGLIYPCLYLKEDVITSKGNGTITNPYYVN